MTCSYSQRINNVLIIGPPCILVICSLLFIVDNELTSFYSFQELICQIKIEWQAPPLLPRWSLSFHNYDIIYKLQHDEFSSFAIVDLLPYDPSNQHWGLKSFVQVKLALTIWTMFDCQVNMQLTHAPRKVNSHNLGFSGFLNFIPWNTTSKSWANTRRNDTITHSQFQTYSCSMFAFSNSLIRIHNNMQLTHVPSKVNFHNLGFFMVLWLYTLE